MTVLRSEQPCKGFLARYESQNRQIVVHANDKSEARALLKKYYRDEKVPKPWNMELVLLSRKSKETFGEDIEV